MMAGAGNNVQKAYLGSLMKQADQIRYGDRRLSKMFRSVDDAICIQCR
jgi:hypothetical protein